MTSEPAVPWIVPDAAMVTVKNEPSTMQEAAETVDTPAAAAARPDPSAKVATSLRITRMTFQNFRIHP